MSERTEAPAWFLNALATEPELGSVEVDGARIAYRAWGPAGGDGVVLVHGGAAHARWWDHIGPLLAGAVRVVAPDMSGHRDSAHRDSYSLDQWADEVLAAATAAGITGAPIVIGHSMGGLVALRAGRRDGPRLRAVAAVDSPVRDFTPEERAARDGQAFEPPAAGGAGSRRRSRISTLSCSRTSAATSPARTSTSTVTWRSAR